jgi:hypothetical protein
MRRASSFCSTAMCGRCVVVARRFAMPSALAMRGCGWNNAALHGVTVVAPTTSVRGVVTQTLPGDWACQVCNFNNFRSRTECKNCNAARPGPRPAPPGGRPRDGDWVCTSCQFSNFASRGLCKNCGSQRTDQGTPASFGGNAKSQAAPVTSGSRDWVCPNCVFSNFGSREACGKCNGPRSSVPSTWTCASCQTANGATSLSCTICGELRAAGNPASPGGVPPVGSVGDVASGARRQSGTARPGDWICAHCQSLNFARRTHCIGCAQANPRPGNAKSVSPPAEGAKGAPAGSTAHPVRKGDWTCSCGTVNFAFRTACYTCSSLKPATTTTVQGDTTASL